MAETKFYSQGEYKKFMEDKAYWEVQLAERNRVYQALIASSDTLETEKETAVATHAEEVKKIQEKLDHLAKVMKKHPVEPYQGPEGADVKMVSEPQLLNKMKELAQKKLDLEKNKEDISSARAYGDLSENSEYTEAKDEQTKLNSQISALVAEITHAALIVGETVDYSKVSIGAYVTGVNLTKNKPFRYHIVGSYETNPLSGETYRPISDESPIGSAIIGHGAGETVTAVMADGQTKMEIKIESVSHQTPADAQ